MKKFFMILCVATHVHAFSQSAPQFGEITPEGYIIDNRGFSLLQSDGDVNSLIGKAELFSQIKNFENCILEIRPYVVQLQATGDLSEPPFELGWVSVRTGFSLWIRCPPKP